MAQFTDSISRLRHVSSRQNALVKELRQAFSHAALTDDGHCAIEGVRVIEEAVRSGLRFKALFVSEGAEERAQRLLPQISSHAEALLLPHDLFTSAISTDTPQGVAALIKVKQFTVEDVVAGTKPLILIAAGIQDPGNLGTMLRSAEAFGATGAVFTEGTVSQWNAKVVRAAAGSLFRLPVVKLAFQSMLPLLKQREIKLVGTSSHKGARIDEADLSGPIALLIGNEGAGIDRHVFSQINELVAIPHSPKVESLNAAVAASVLLYEAARQRRVS
jgi:RNA methyltransferase, TrmH family